VVTPQFAVFKNTRNREAFPYLLLVQHVLLSGLPVRVVVPLSPRKRFSGPAVPRLNPVFEIDGQEVAMMTHLIGSVSAGSLNKPVAHLTKHRSELIAALDTLFSGV
jgi:toxin CcdB